MGVSSAHDGFDVAGFTTDLADAAALAETAGLVVCAKPGEASASVQAIINIANPGGMHWVRSFSKTACAIVLAI